MILEALLTVIKYLLYGIIALLPKMPTVRLDYLDGVFQLLSMTDLLVNVRVLGGCIVTIVIVMNIEIVWSIIMWVVRKIPGVN